MTWLGSLGVAFLTGLATMFAAGFVAAMAVDWYHVSSREGAAGYFVIGMALLAFIVGGLIGLIASRVVAGSQHPSFLLGLGSGVGVALGITLVVGVVARLLADVPPTIDGDALIVAVEVRYPASQRASPATDTLEGKVALHSIPAFSHTVRVSQNGPLWKGDAHQVDGRWVVPGAVSLFTERGKRMLEIELDDSTHYGFLIPLGRRPGRAAMAWSEWMPRARPGAPPLPDQMTIRFRIFKQTEVVRTQRVGDFEVGTIPGFYYDIMVGERTYTVSQARYTLAHDGKPVSLGGGAPIGAVVRSPNGLVVLTQPPDSEAECFYLVPGTEGVKVDSLGHCGTYALDVAPLTNDSAIFRDFQGQNQIPGRVDTITLARPGIYLLNKTVLDTRNGAVHQFSSDSIFVPVPAVPPLGLSPDERSIVRYGFDRDSSDKVVLIATDIVADRSYLLPVDPMRMRYPALEGLDPAWLAHHFEWRKGAEGHDELVERRHFTPLPYFGAFTTIGAGKVYRIEKAGRELREKLIGFLEQEYKAKREPADSDAYELPLTIDGKHVDVAASGDFSYVMVSMPDGAVDSALIARIGADFNRVLATGKYDALFGP